MDFSYTATILFTGQFNITGSQTDTGCQDPTNNGTTSYTGVLNIPSQPNNSFVGTLSITSIDGIPLAGTNASITGTYTASVNQQTNATGNYTLESFLSGVLFGQNQGTFTGTLTANSISVSYMGMDVPNVGSSPDTCQSTGSFTGSR